jgi:hypothetical protein
VFQTPDNPFGEFGPELRVILAHECFLRSRYASSLHEQLLLTLIVGVTGSGRGVTDYKRMGKHKFETERGD